MHEATIAQSILKIASTKLKQTPNAERVLDIRIIVGEFRNVDIESLHFAFDNLKDMYEGLDRCVLQTDKISAQAICRTSKHIYHPNQENHFCCTICGDGIGNLVSGEELDVIGVKLQATTNKDDKTGQGKDCKEEKYA
jgi:Zn finger protein HypA/HybF involved in hydrogenase expression